MVKSIGQIAYEDCMKILSIPANWELLPKQTKIEWERAAKNFLDKLKDYAS